MKHILTCLFLLFGLHTSAQVLWFEDFEDDVNGAQTGTAVGTVGGNWQATYAGAGTFSKQDPFGSNVFLVSDTDTEGEWRTSAPVNIAGTGRAIIEATVVGFFVQSGDYIRCYYRVNGAGPEILFFEQTGALLSFTLTGSAIVTGNSLEIIMRSNVDGNLGFDAFSMNDVRITGVNTLYSRKAGNWDDVTAGNGTWSAASLGGASCDCTPLTTDYLIVGHTVDINVTATAGGIEIRNTGSLRHTVDALEINIDRGILQIDAGGSINRNGRVGVQLDFDRGVVTTFVNNGTITTEDIEVTAPNTLIYLTGSGSITLTDDFSILNDDIIIDHDLTGTFTIGDDLIFDQAADALTDDAIFINRRTLTVTSDLVVGANNDDDNIFTNALGATLNISGITLNDADFDILNSGTINQSGNFLNIDAADTNLDNLATGVWNWSFVQAAFDAALSTVLNCTTVGNIFNYQAAGNQNIISTPYHHLTISGSGSKFSQTAVDINGNLLIAGTAILNISTSVDNITLAGNWTVTSTNPDPFSQGAQTVTLDGTANAQTISTVLAAGETFGSLVLNNTSGTPPQIIMNSNVTVSGVLTMTSGIVNLNGRPFVITSALAASLVHGLTSASGWMYGSTLSRAVPAGAVAVSTAAGLFPLGTATSFRPLFVGKPGATSTGTTTVLHDGTLSTTSAVSIADDFTIVLRHNSFWDVTTTATGGANTWSLRAGGTNFGTIASTTHLRVCAPATVVGNPGVNSGTVADPRVERLSLSIAQVNGNNFHIGSIDAVNSPLPIELASFNAVAENGKVRLDWTTVTEVENDFFTVERTVDAEEFEQVEKVEGQGTTTEKTTYVSYDNLPRPGVTYYRLKQTDFNGRFTYSKLVKVEMDEIQTRLVAYPNPTTNQQVTLAIRGLKPFEEFGLSITDMRGNSAYQARHIATANGDVQSTIDLSNASKGLYIIRISSSTMMNTKLIVE